VSDTEDDKQANSVLIVEHLFGGLVRHIAFWELLLARSRHAYKPLAWWMHCMSTFILQVMSGAAMHWLNVVLPQSPIPDMSRVKAMRSDRCT